MKPTIRAISPRKYFRLSQSRKVKTVNASRFNDKTWETKPLYDAFTYCGFLYYRERTSENQFHLVAKRVAVENTHKGAIVYYVI